MKKLGLMFVAIFVSMAILGVSYASWQDTIFVNNTALIGTISGRFEQAATNDPSVFNDPIENGFWTLNVSNIPVWSGNRDPLKYMATTGQPLGLGTNTLTVQFVTPYAGYLGSTCCTIKSTGTIPLKIENVTFIKSGPVGDPEAANMNITFNGALDKDLHTVIEPGNVALGIIRPQFLAGVNESGDYSVMVTFTVIPWNQSVP